MLEESLPFYLTFSFIQLTRIGEGDLRKAYDTIEERLREVKEYVGIWLQYQALWDMEASSLYIRLGDDLFKWQRLLEEIKKSRRTFDNSESEKRFGCIVIQYGQVQSSVNHKYDLWHKDVLKKFGTKLADAMRIFHVSRYLFSCKEAAHRRFFLLTFSFNRALFLEQG